MTDGERIFAVNMADSWTVMTNITQVSMTLLNQRTIHLEVKEIHVGFNFISLYLYVIQFFFFWHKSCHYIYLRYVWGMIFLLPNGKQNVWEVSFITIHDPFRYFCVCLITLLFYLITPFFYCFKVCFRKGNGRMQWPSISFPGDTGGEPILTTTSPWRTSPRSLLQRSGQSNTVLCGFLLIKQL